MDTLHVQALDILADPLFAMDHNQARIISLAASAHLPSVAAAPNDASADPVKRFNEQELKRLNGQ